MPQLVVLLLVMFAGSVMLFTIPVRHDGRRGLFEQRTGLVEARQVPIDPAAEDGEADR